MSSSSGAQRRLRLQSIEYGARNINLYRFVAIDGRPLEPVEPGAHIDLEISGDYRRSYSLINSSPEPTEYVIGVCADPKGRGGSRTWHSDSVVGSTYCVSAPRNTFRLAERHEAAYLFAGGIGITPIVNMYRHLRAIGTSAKLFYWARTDEDVIYHAELSADENVRIFLTGEGDERAPKISEIVRSVPEDADLYCCGPAGMLAEYEAASASRPRHLVHSERFNAAPIAINDGTFTVRLARHGITLEIRPGQTILGACLDAGLDVAYSCEEGICGACEAKVLSGGIEHRDSFRTPEAHDREKTIMICCSVAKAGELVLDL